MQGKAVVITSGKGGVGKTTAVANLGTALGLMGQRVVVIDADIGLRNLDVVMGLENRIVYDLVNVIEGTCRMKQALIKDRRTDGLYLMPAAQTRQKSAIQPDQMQELCEELRQDFDYILIDSPAGIEQGFRNAMAGAAEAIIITTPEVSAIRDADRVIGLLEAEGMGSPTLIINRVQANMVREGDMVSRDDILELLAVDLLGIVPEDRDIIVSTNRGIPVVHDPKSKSGEAFRRIAGRMEGDEVPLMAVEETGSIVSRLKRMVGL